MNRRAFLKATITGIGVFGSISCSEKKSSKKNTAYLAAKSPRANVKAANITARRHDTDSSTYTDIRDEAMHPGVYEGKIKGVAFIKEQIVMKVTAYCPCSKCCGCYADGITASGHKIQKGDMLIAADKCYPFGTIMHVPGYSDIAQWLREKAKIYVRVLDRGGAIKGNHIDVFFNTHQEALNWGVRYLTVTVIFTK